MGGSGGGCGCCRPATCMALTSTGGTCCLRYPGMLTFDSVGQAQLGAEAGVGASAARGAKKQKLSSDAEEPEAKLHTMVVVVPPSLPPCPPAHHPRTPAAAAPRAFSALSRVSVFGSRRRPTTPSSTCAAHQSSCGTAACASCTRTATRSCAKHSRPRTACCGAAPKPPLISYTAPDSPEAL